MALSGVRKVKLRFFSGGSNWWKEIKKENKNTPAQTNKSVHIQETRSLPINTARREEEPVHEDTRAVIVRIIGKQSVPFVLLLTTTVAVTPQGGHFPGHMSDDY